jgi:hypothetical protein
MEDSELQWCKFKKMEERRAPTTMGEGVDVREKGKRAFELGEARIFERELPTNDPCSNGSCCNKGGLSGRLGPD